MSTVNTSTPPIHTRDARRPVAVETGMSPEWAERAAADAHAMFVKLARHLDVMAHILERSGLDTEHLLDIPSRAGYPSAMRTSAVEIAERLRAQADLLDGYVWWRGFAPRHLPEDDPVAWRPLSNLTWDAKRIRAMAKLVERDVTPAPRPAPRVVRVGELHLLFRNAINGRTRQLYPETLQDAAILAREYRPYNNTDVQLFRVVEIRNGSTRVEEIEIPAAA